MLTRIKISNFKSLSDFELDGLEKFVCLVGMNGSGKTTLLQALDFIGHLAKGEADFRNWEKGDIISSGTSSRMCSFSVELQLMDWPGDSFVWEGKYNLDRQRFSEEFVRHVHEGKEKVILSLKERRLIEVCKVRRHWHAAWNEGTGVEVCSTPEREIQLVKSISDYTFKGSVLAAFRFQNEQINRVRDELQSLKSLELLSPQSMRKASQAMDEVDIGGGGLAGFLEKLSPEDSADLGKRLAFFYPEVTKLSIKKVKLGWRRLLVNEAMLRNPVSANHINDGLLRMIAILSQRYSRNSFVLLDEIENGINQEVIGKLVSELNDFNGKQVMVTTHSPLVLNYLTDEQAKASVVFLYKDPLGHTHARKFFDIPGIAERLSFMGPGEIMGNTDLIKLANDVLAGEIG